MTFSTFASTGLRQHVSRTRVQLPSVSAGVALVIVLLGGAAACSALRGAGAQQVDAPLPALDGPNLLFQPMVTWSYEAPAGQGTGFFVEHAAKRYGVTSSHFLLDASAGELVEIAAAGVVGDDTAPIATTHFSWGVIGTDAAGALDLSRYHDYTILPFADWSQPVTTLKLSDAQTWEVGTAVWLPAKDRTAKNGIRWTSGKVTESVVARVDVELDAVVDLTSLSGSPVLEASTGAVIGTLSRAAVEEGKPIALQLTPASAIVRAIESAQAAHSLPVARRVALIRSGPPVDTQVIAIKRLDRDSTGGDGWISLGRAETLSRGVEFLATTSADTFSATAARWLSLDMAGRLPVRTLSMLTKYATAAADQRLRAVGEWMQDHESDVQAVCPDLASVLKRIESAAANDKAKVLVEGCPVASCSSTISYPNEAVFIRDGDPPLAFLACVLVEQLKHVGGPHPLELELIQGLSGGFHQRYVEPERAKINEIYGQEKV